jgi:hypothetical protein
MFAAAWHDLGDNVVWIALVLGALETIRRIVTAKARKAISWFKDKREEDQATARVIEDMQAFVTKNNGGTSLLDQVQTINRKLDNHSERLVMIEDYITNPRKVTR